MAGNVLMSRYLTGRCSKVCLLVNWILEVRHSDRSWLFVFCLFVIFFCSGTFYILFVFVIQRQVLAYY